MTPDVIPGKQAILVRNLETNEEHYEYVDSPDAELQQKIDALGQAVALLLLNGGGTSA